MKLSYSFSYFSGGIKSITPTRTITLSKFMESVRSDLYKNEIQHLRGLTDEATQRIVKNKLDFCIPSGVFTTRAVNKTLEEKMQEASGLLSLDIDNYSGDYSSLKKKITKDKHVAAVFDSPRGRLKIFIAIPLEKDNHSFLSRWYASTKFFAKEWGIDQTDFDTLKDITRACFCSWDPNAYYNPKPKVFEGFEEVQEIKGKKSDLDYKELIEEGVKEGGRNESMFRLACFLVHQGVEEPHILSTLKATNEKNNPPLDDREIDTILKHAIAYKKEEYPYELNYEKLKDSLESKNSLDENITTEKVSDILGKEIPKPEWRVETLVPESGVTYIAGSPGEGKSLITNYLAQCISAGKEFLGLKVKQGKIVYFDAENGEVCAWDRLKRIAEGNAFAAAELECMQYSIFPNIRFDVNSTSYPDLLTFFDKHKPDVAVFDSLVRFMDGSENDAESCKKVFDCLRYLLKQYPKLSIIILHHVTKNNDGGMNSLRGSSELAAAASSIVMLKRQAMALKLSVEKSRYIDMGQGFNLFYTIENDSKENIVFSVTEGKGDIDTTAGGLAEKDFWNWINDKEIETFKTKNLLNVLKTKAHSESAILRMRNGLESRGYIMKVSHGLYEIKNQVFTTEEVVEDV